jgi:hypothetical protein
MSLGYLKEFFQQFSDSEIFLADELRKLRNKIAYKGFFITPDFLARNEERIRQIIKKLMKILEDKLNN